MDKARVIHYIRFLLISEPVDCRFLILSTTGWRCSKPISNRAETVYLILQLILVLAYALLTDNRRFHETGI
jgi:hypothetical protein